MCPKMCPHLSSNSCPPLRVSASLSTLSVSVSKKKHSSPHPCPRPCPRPRPRHMPAFHARAHARVPCPHPLLNFTFSWVFGKIERKKLKPTFVQNSISKYKKALYKADDNHATYIYEVKTWNSWVPRYSIFIYTFSFDVILWNILLTDSSTDSLMVLLNSATTVQFCQQFTAGDTASNWHNQDI